LALLLLLTTGRLEIWHIYLATTLNSTCSSFQRLAYYASSTLLVPKEHFGRASGMIQLERAVAQVITPVLAAWLVLMVDIQGVILIDVVTFIFALFTLQIVRVPKPETSAAGQESRDSFLSEATFGWTYVKARSGLLGLSLFFAATNLGMDMVLVLITPLVLSFTGISTLGTVLFVGGIGLLCGGVVMSVWGGPKRRVNGVYGFMLLGAIATLLGGLQPSIPLIAMAVFILSLSNQIISGCAQAIWQSKVEPDLQGRVFTVRRLIAYPTTCLAYLIAGPLADNVLEPLLAEGGRLAGSIGQIIGIGPGRGIGFLCIVSGILNILITIVAYSYPRLRLVEDELPDAIADQDIHVSDKKEKRMKRIRKWLAYAGITLLVIVIVLVGTGVWFVRRPWPKVNGAITVSGLTASVEVIRDKWGVPHIYAQNEHDLFFAQGYIHAQDRLWQMELNRHIGNGTLSAVLGKATLDIDRFIHTVNLRRIAEQSWAAMDGDDRSILEAYVRGVNAYIETHRSRLPLEFTILGVDPEPWTPIDTLVWGNAMALDLGSNRELELLRAQLIAELGTETVQQLFPPRDEDTPIIIPAEASGYDWLRNVRFESLTRVNEWLGNPDEGWGSNNWVIHGSRTDTGKPILANDMHLGFEMPPIWYENGLHGGRFDSVGFTFPGVPLIVIGHNQHIAWGITNLGPDVQDLYLEKLDDPENPTQYEFMGEWHDLEIIQETIEVKGSAPVMLNVLLTQHGPIVNDVILDEPDETEPMSLRWALFEGSELFESIVRLNLATNWSEFCAALRDWSAPGQNFVYADIEGNIGYQATGRIPIRVSGHQGLVPVPGWTGGYEWQGFIPFDELPNAFNPPAGFIVTANNKVISDDYPYLLSYDWDVGYRAKRITELLTADDDVTVEDVKDIQAQTYSPVAEILRPYLLAIEPENDLQAQALAHVQAWDLYYETDRVGASIYETWHMFMLQNTVVDELSHELEDEELVNQYQSRQSNHTLTVIELMPEADNVWFDNVNTPGVETRDDIVRRSLAEAVNWLSERYGQNPDRWEWGRMYTVTFVHTPLGQSGIAPLERIFNSRTVPARGGDFSVNMAADRGDQPFKVTFGTSQRMIVDLSDWGNSLTINTTGQSGHLFHPHREDLISMWQNVEYHPMFFTWEAVEANAEAVLTLTPQ